MALLDQIKLLDPTLVANRDEVAIAAALSVGRRKRNLREIGNGGVLETIGLPAGNMFLDVVNSNTNFRYVKPLLEQGRLVVGSPLVQATLQSLVPSILTQANADALCNLGWDADPVSPMDVRKAIWTDNGDCLI